jgi:acyl dehydratase
VTGERTIAPEAIPIQSGAPFYEDLTVGDVFADVPGLTLTSGHAALHQAIIGDRLRLPLDAALAARVLPDGRMPVHPALVCDVAIGQSTLATQRVIANLFYRGLRLLRAPGIGDTLRTTTEVVALRDNRPRRNAPPTGVAALRIRTVDQCDRPVLDFWRCAMLPLGNPARAPGRHDDLDAIGNAATAGELDAAVAGWDLAAFRAALPDRSAPELVPGTTWVLESGETVSGAPELARLTLNVARTHTDPGGSAHGRRLVYGGHTIGVAAAHVTRALPDLVYIVAWHECRHVAPVFEGDVLHSVVQLERVDRRSAGGALVHLRVIVRVNREGKKTEVLDWRFVGVLP